MGVVTKVMPTFVGLRLGRVIFRVNKEALVKVHEFRVGDTVRIKDDLFQVRVLNERLGWRSSMDKVRWLLLLLLLLCVCVCVCVCVVCVCVCACCVCVCVCVCVCL